MGREEHCKQISLACVRSARSVSATLGLPLVSVYVLSRSTLPRLQVALQGNCLNQALDFVHFSGLSCSVSGSQVLHKGVDSVGPLFCALPRSKQLRRPGAWRVHTSQVRCVLSPPQSSRMVSWVCSGSTVSGVPCVSFGELISDCDLPGRCQPFRIPGRLD